MYAISWDTVTAQTHNFVIPNSALSPACSVIDWLGQQTHIAGLATTTTYTTDFVTVQIGVANFRSVAHKFVVAYGVDPEPLMPFKQQFDQLASGFDVLHASDANILTRLGLT